MYEASPDRECGNNRNPAGPALVKPTISMGLFVLALCAVACSGAPQPPEELAKPLAAPANEPAYSSADSLLLLLNTPETFDVLQRHIPFFVNLTEHGIIPAFSTELTLNDLLQVPESKVTPEDIRSINEEFAALVAPRRD